MPPIKCTHTSRPAALFVSISLGSRPATAPTVSILDLLLPLRPVRKLHLAPRNRIARVPHEAHAPWKALIRRTPGAPLTREQRRTFSASAARRATHAIHNPQKDDDGNEMLLEITPRAAQRLSEIMAKDSNPNLALRIQVESGGCHGFQYLMSLVTLPPAATLTDLPAGEDSSATIRKDDTIFAFASHETLPGNWEVPKIILDAASLELLKGSKVDFTMELIGSQFKIVDNPLATSSCGCGTSFDIKI